MVSLQFYPVFQHAQYMTYRAGPSAARPAPPRLPPLVSGAPLSLGAGLLLAWPSPLLPLSSPALPRGPTRPLFGFTAPSFCNVPVTVVLDAAVG